MVRTRLPHVDLVREDSSSFADSSTNLIPRSISSVTWTQLPPLRADPLDVTSRKWMTDRSPAIRPFCTPPSSGNDFFRDSLVALSVRREEALLFHEVSNTPTHTVGPSLLRSRLIRGEFPWVPCTFVARASITSCWAEWVKHTFGNDLPFFDIMERVGIADAKAKELKTDTIESAKYSREFLARLRSDSFVAASNPKTSFGKVRGSGNVLPPDKRKVAQESLKYTFATWVRYFFGDVDKGIFYPGPSLPQPLKHTAFLAYWLSNFYGRLDQIQEQLFISFGRFPINSFVDLVFLQYFLFKRFPQYAPVRTIPDSPADDEDRPLETRIWSWTMGRLCHSLLDLLDEEDQFVHRPYVASFFPGTEGLHRIYKEDELITHNIRSSRSEGVFDICSLSSYDASKFIPTDRTGCVLDLWIAYYARLKNSVKRYESQDSMQNFTNVQIMCKDPYYSTTTFKVLDAQAKEPPRVSGKKRKVAPLPKGKKGASASCEVVPPLPKKATRSCKSVLAGSPSPVTKKNSSTRSAKASNTDETTQDDEVIQESFLPSETKRLDVKAQSATSPAADVSEVPPPADTHPTEVASSQALIVVPLSSSAPTLSTELHPSLSTLLSEEDALLLSEFSVKHDGFLLSEYAFPTAFMKLAYSFFADFLRFMRAHSYMDLLSIQKDKVLGDLKSLRCLGFNGAWLDELFAHFDRSIPTVTFENLQRAQDVVHLQEQHNSQLASHIEALSLELSQGEVELARLNAKCKEIVDARVGLDVNFHI
ncbi:hypothetical protein SESBI_35226 [Sesbania bispinosa]|nr:hypothetical protein SESBI_35226 [Sesbania bispinosa]